MADRDAYLERLRAVFRDAGLDLSLAAALEGAIAALAADGKLTDADAAAVEVARCMAVAVTFDPTNAALWREYRAAVAALMEAGDDEHDDGIETFRLSLSLPAAPRASRTEVGNPADA